MEMFVKEEWRDTLSSIGLLILRVWIGLTMLIAHGWPKLSGFSEKAETFADPFGVGSTMSLAMAVGAEVFASIFIIFGLLTRAMAVPLLITMLVAAFIIHGDDPYQKQEFALLFGFTYLTLIFTGPGKYAVDTFLERAWKNRG